MIDQITWTERRFTFDHPVGWYPCFLGRMAGTPARVEEIAATVSTDQLKVRDGDAWSIQEHIGHLYMVEELFEIRLDEFIARADKLHPADMSGKQTYVEDFNAKTIEEVLAIFRARREAFVAKLAGVDDDIIGRSAHHPRLNKPMRLIDMVYFQAEHDDYHIAKILALRAKL